MPETLIRAATADDLDVILSHLRTGFASYVEFTPPGWRPPEPRRERTAELLARPTTWAAIALEGDRSVGHVSFTPARGRPFEEEPDAWRSAPPIPGRAHLWQLFVVPDRWGDGVAGRLHEVMIEAMVERGYTDARLYTPVAHARARRFYERRGWTWRADGPGGEMGFDLSEYTLELSRR
ncbi:MAG: GNAT family N-acetyltransferase [Solirubrobacterales bacterium]